MTAQITVQVTIGAAIADVWTFWAEPKHIVKWNHASEDWYCPRVSNDLRTGGKYSARMEAKDGSFGFDFDLVYDEVIEHAHIAYTMLDGRKVTVDFAGLGDITKVVTTFDTEEQNALDVQRNGWQAILDNFKAYVEGGSGAARQI